jgi:hypothetical protein
MDLFHISYLRVNVSKNGEYENSISKNRGPFTWAPKNKITIFFRESYNDFDLISVIYVDHLPK